MVGAVWCPDFVFTMIGSSVILFRLYSANLQFHCCLDLIPIHPCFKYTEATKLSDHCRSDNIRPWVWFIYWLIFFLCLTSYYCFVLFMLTYFYIFIIIVLRYVPHAHRLSTEVTTLSEHSNSDNIRRQGIYIDLMRIFVSICIHTIALS